MNYLKIVLGWSGTLVFALIAAYAVTKFPACRRVTVPPGTKQINALESNDNKGLDGTATINSFSMGDVVCYRLGEKEIEMAKFAYVAGVPGDVIEIQGRDVLVNGNSMGEAAKSASKVLGFIGNREPVMVPADHLFIITDRHREDSIALGPIPMASIRGRIRNWAQ